jgi:hypothetical protein
MTKRHIFAEKAVAARYSKSDLRRMVEEDGVASNGGNVVNLR